MSYLIHLSDVWSGVVLCQRVVVSSLQRRCGTKCIIVQWTSPWTTSAGSFYACGRWDKHFFLWSTLPDTTMDYHTGGYYTLSHPPAPIFRARYLHRWNSAGVPRRSGVGNMSPRAFRRPIVRYRHPLGCRAIDLGKRSQRGVIYIVLYCGLWSPKTIVVYSVIVMM